MAKNYDNLVVKLYHETDGEIIDFLEEKDANTFVTKEALRMFIKNYRMMENMSINGGTAAQQTAATPPPKPEPSEPRTVPSQIGDVFRSRNNIIGK
ncbi:hypothetical protein CN613_25390 [Bacillus pseudomycoides]|uniref:Uncharacterized protein n=1 Tax=Bacillus pseudomycoides TaxID=64104 RepID=A0A2A8BYC8_9BACI|nr:hypothetical protein [Bacillus pseudomycoides]PEM65282.1 hypothetical protein CN613_25390 [Bacillus pseudomycoides]